MKGFAFRGNLPGFHLLIFSVNFRFSVITRYWWLHMRFDRKVVQGHWLFHKLVLDFLNSLFHFIWDFLLLVNCNLSFVSPGFQERRRELKITPTKFEPNVELNSLKAKTFLYFKVKTSWSCLQWFYHNTPALQTNRQQRDRQHLMTIAKLCINCIVISTKLTD